MRRFQWIIDHENPITGYWNVVIFVHVKIDEIVQNCNFQQEFKSHYLSNQWLDFNDLWFIRIVLLRRIYFMKFTSFALIDRTVFTKVSKQLNANIFSPINVKTWNSWISCDSMRQFQGIKDLENSITGYWIVVIFVHAKIDKIVQNCNFWQKVKWHYHENQWFDFHDIWFIGIATSRRS